MTSLVTGAAGFVGSHLVEALLARGEEVVALDVFRDSEAPGERGRNIASFKDRVRFLRLDLSRDDIAPALEGVDVVYHLAARPGVRASWGDSFDDYLRDNLLATQRLAEAAGGVAAAGRGIRRFIFASSSSVYGDARECPTDESSTRAPISPYGVTKAACEDLLRAYHIRDGLPAVILRYFTVFGPRQRPDQAVRRLFESAAHGTTFRLFGDGTQSREWTFVADAVNGTIRAGEAPNEAVGQAINIGGGSRAVLAEVIGEVERLTGRPILLDARPIAAGDVRATHAEIGLARRLLGYGAGTDWKEGLRRMHEWFSARKEG